MPHLDLGKLWDTRNRQWIGFVADANWRVNKVFVADPG